MTLIIFAVIALQIFMILKKNRSVISTTISILVLFIITTAMLIWVLYDADGGETLNFFHSRISRNGIYCLIAAWYLVDIICSIIIIKHYFDYIKANIKNKA